MAGVTRFHQLWGIKRSCLRTQGGGVSSSFSTIRLRRLCPDSVLAEVEEYARDYDVPELPQVVFLAMLLNDVVKLIVLRRWMIMVMESALKELQWSAFQAWVGRNRGRILEACQYYRGLTMWYFKVWPSGQEINGRPHGPSLGWGAFETVIFVPDNRSCQGNLQVALEECHASPSSTLEHYRDLYLRFTFSDADKVAYDFELPKMVQATFYAVLLNDAVALGLVDRCDLLEAQLCQQTPLRRCSWASG
ncbi:hypothetical protein Cgig2_000662 [Carnegiea gigantea]|uniref:Uncharacterized protein n=1 Tax=Carnegiea gigantea TaxID=171969 RepID=A0A9Q1GJD0_9CARY|nr:hypothetical protein Cgig2_000662 [Carnegiea gigantea]